MWEKQALDFYSGLVQVWATLTLSPSPQVLQNFFSAIKHNQTKVWNSLTDRDKWKYKDKCIIFSDVSESRRWRCVRLCRGKHPWRDFVQVGLPGKLFLQRLKLLLQRLPRGQQSSSPLFPSQFNIPSRLPPRFPFLLDQFNIFSPRRLFHLDSSLQHPPSLNPALGQPTEKRHFANKGFAKARENWKLPKDGEIQISINLYNQWSSWTIWLNAVEIFDYEKHLKFFYSSKSV